MEFLLLNNSLKIKKYCLKFWVRPDGYFVYHPASLTYLVLLFVPGFVKKKKQRKKQGIYDIAIYNNNWNYLISPY